MTAQEFLESKGWEANDPVMGGALQKGVAMLMEEYAEQRVTKAVERYHDFENELEEKVLEDNADLTDIGEFVVEYFDLWR